MKINIDTKTIEDEKIPKIFVKIIWHQFCSVPVHITFGGQKCLSNLVDFIFIAELILAIKILIK